MAKPAEQEDGDDDSKVLAGAWVDRVEAAEIAEVNERTFRNWERARRIPGSRVVGRGPGAKWMYPRDELDRWLAERQADSADEAPDLLASTAQVMSSAARASHEIHKSAALALSAAASAIKEGNDRTNQLLEGYVKELNRRDEHVDRLEGKQVELWNLIAEIHNERAAALLQSAREQAAEILNTERSKFMVESFRMAWPGLMHKLLPSEATEHAILTGVFKTMSSDLQADFMRLVEKLAPESQMTLGALLQPVLEQISKDNDVAKNEKEKGPTP